MCQVDAFWARTTHRNQLLKSLLMGQRRRNDIFPLQFHKMILHLVIVYHPCIGIQHRLCANHDDNKRRRKNTLSHRNSEARCNSSPRIWPNWNNLHCFDIFDAWREICFPLNDAMTNHTRLHTPENGWKKLKIMTEKNSNRCDSSFVFLFSCARCAPLAPLARMYMRMRHAYAPRVGTVVAHIHRCVCVLQFLFGRAQTHSCLSELSYNVLALKLYQLNNNFFSDI